MICPECGSDTISRIEGSSLVIECPKCGWSVATSHIDPIFEDETVYTVTVANGNVPDKAALKAVSSVIGENYIAAKRALESPGTVLLRGRAPEVRECVDRLTDSNVAFEVSPRFPY